MKHLHHQISDLYNSLIYLTNKKLSLRPKNHLHQLRIATRKFQALLRLLKFGIPKKLFRKVQKLLDTIRRKAGQTRNLQLFLENIRKATFSNTSLKKILTTHIQKTIRLSKARFCLFAKKRKSKLSVLLKEVSSQMMTICKLKPSKIKHDKVRGFKKRVESAIGNKRIEFKEIHELRITAKKLRYQFEIISEMQTSKHHQSAIRRLRKIQKTLGRITDQKLFIRHLIKLRKHFKKESDVSLTELDGMLWQAKQRFLKATSSMCLKKII
jgi:CHAD domain-containing protein